MMEIIDVVLETLGRLAGRMSRGLRATTEYRGSGSTGVGAPEHPHRFAWPQGARPITGNGTPPFFDSVGN
jgi:hypothetical protein